MKLVISIILIMLLSFCTCLFLPWWCIAFAAFIVTVLMPLRPGIAFIAGFIALFLLWGGLAFWISNNNENILAHRVSLLILKVDNPMFLILSTSLIGALVAAFAALSGSYFRRILYPNELSSKRVKTV